MLTLLEEVEDAGCFAGRTPSSRLLLIVVFSSKTAKCVSLSNVLQLSKCVHFESKVALCLQVQHKKMSRFDELEGDVSGYRKSVGRVSQVRVKDV